MVKNDRKEIEKNKQKSSIIGTSETLISNRGATTPHFRCGFFRYYRDDRYVNMKGKVQFIESTMVKGSARTIIS